MITRSNILKQEYSDIIEMNIQKQVEKQYPDRKMKPNAEKEKLHRMKYRSNCRTK